jgi:hypothetical protein
MIECYREVSSDFGKKQFSRERVARREFSTRVQHWTGLDHKLQQSIQSEPLGCSLKRLIGFRMTITDTVSAEKQDQRGCLLVPTSIVWKYRRDFLGLWESSFVSSGCIEKDQVLFLVPFISSPWLPRR